MLLITPTFSYSIQHQFQNTRRWEALLEIFTRSVEYNPCVGAQISVEVGPTFLASIITKALATTKCGIAVELEKKGTFFIHEVSCCFPTLCSSFLLSCQIFTMILWSASMVPRIRMNWNSSSQQRSEAMGDYNPGHGSRERVSAIPLIGMSDLELKGTPCI